MILFWSSLPIIWLPLKQSQIKHWMPIFVLAMLDHIGIFQIILYFLILNACSGICSLLFVPGFQAPRNQEIILSVTHPLVFSGYKMQTLMLIMLSDNRGLFLASTIVEVKCCLQIYQTLARVCIVPSFFIDTLFIFSFKI